ncbi:MAG: single-stranded DNA-binding protein [Luteolibacter sp.]|jgi:single-strand selective monofunctional uracil DNA glycosylase|nr:single-stranded DNA-binding protein [Luteolibacter sp.]
MKELIESTKRLSHDLAALEFTNPVACVYRPLEYAWEAHRIYLERFSKGEKRVVFLGMNPGPYGMAQTGVPFGEVAAVRDWMGIEAAVGKPAHEHEKRPVEGFQCRRSEVSGRRLWGLFAECYPAAEDFFKDHFVLNYCPLVWMSASGANLTPDKLPVSEMMPVEQACLTHLAEVIGILKPSFLIGIGGFAEERLHRAADVCASSAKLGRILHPSPASPAANRGWAEAASRQLRGLGVW